MNTILEGKTIYVYSRAEHPRFQKSVINMGIKLFNHLSTELKQIDEFNQFRKEVKHHCIPSKNILIGNKINKV